MPSDLDWNEGQPNGSSLQFWHFVQQGAFERCFLGVFRLLRPEPPDPLGGCAVAQAWDLPDHLHQPPPQMTVP